MAIGNETGIIGRKIIGSSRVAGALLAGALLAMWSIDGLASGGGGGGGGGVTKPPAPVVTLPATPPAPDVILRESFGLADLWRPAGGKGIAKPYSIHTAIAGFWVEYPGSSNTAWLAPLEPAQTWRVCGATDDPFEMPSPLQQTYGNGCLFSDFFDPIAEHPAALMPFTAPATPYQLSIDAWATGAPGADPGYLGFGLTSSSLLTSNLESTGSVWFEIVVDIARQSQSYALRLDGRTGPILASGTTMFDPHTRLVIRYNPVTGTLGASINEIELGVFQQSIAKPRFIALEGVGIVDNLVVRKLP
jgi:hypothetical protein